MKAKPKRKPKPKPYGARGGMPYFTNAKEPLVRQLHDQLAQRAPAIRQGWSRSQKLYGVLVKRLAAWHKESPSAQPAEMTVAVARLLGGCLAATAVPASDREWRREVSKILQLVRDDAVHGRPRIKARVRARVLFRKVAR